MIRVDLKKGESIFCDNMYIYENELHCFIGLESVGKSEIANVTEIYEE